ncbi:acyl carrier protein [Paenibacillus chitinolyticus]|uniref:acyl carrier protein n=1 Tax=Paenibacillus chitinolyticus TaxID=79263 RepID=UPI002DBC771B|nr:acyl carrier protein [Paenibacillus chitinolyticus]MEC0246722.1 acyl carrier protein [Paenibacillus chitinolyticus]
MDAQQLKTSVLACICKVVENTEVDENTDLLAVGMNSMSFVRLVVELEDELNIEIEDGDIDLLNFQTVDSICGIVSRYLA